MIINESSNLMFDVSFKKGGNSEDFTDSGWSAPERDFSWMIGHESIVVIPPIKPHSDLLLTVEINPLSIPNYRIQQTLTLVLNGHVLDSFMLHWGPGYYTFVVQSSLFNRDHNNTLSLIHPDFASPADYGGSDARALSIWMRRLTIEICDLGLLSSPILLAQPHPSDFSTNSLGDIATSFQSLGQNCEFGIFQRLCKVEPLGLFRFSSIVLSDLIDGLSTQFFGIDDPDLLCFNCSKDAELMGHHKLYGLNYHTFKFNHPKNDPKFKTIEVRRLQFLSRILLEQLQNAEKLFVVQHEHLTLREIIPLFRILKKFNTNNILLWVAPVNNDERPLTGRVTRITPFLYKGHIDRLAPSAFVPTLSFEFWRSICTQVFISVQNNNAS